jgi:hypothetical protein
MTTMKIDPIEIRPTQDLRLSTWNFDPPTLRAGEVAHLTRVLLAAGPKTLYEVTRRDGTVFAAHHHRLVECGAFEADQP